MICRTIKASFLQEEHVIEMNKYQVQLKEKDKKRNILFQKTE